MRKVIVISFILLCMMLFAIPALAMKNEPDNFRGIPWGAKVPKNNIFGGNKWKLRHYSLNVYHRDEEVTIGGVKITSSIKYYFFEDVGFAWAIVEFSGRESYDKIRKACIENWGEPDGKRELAYTLAGSNKKALLLRSDWHGGKITVTLERDSETNEGSLSLYMKNLNEIFAREEAASIQKDSGL